MIRMPFDNFMTIQLRLGFLQFYLAYFLCFEKLRNDALLVFSTCSGLI
jgi:hypothetical protein